VSAPEGDDRALRRRGRRAGARRRGGDRGRLREAACISWKDRGRLREAECIARRAVGSRDLLERLRSRGDVRALVSGER